MILKVVGVSTQCMVGVTISARVLTRVRLPTQMYDPVPRGLWGMTSDGFKVSVHGTARSSCGH